MLATGIMGNVRQHGKACHGGRTAKRKGCGHTVSGICGLIWVLATAPSTFARHQGSTDYTET
jgi:hypothetical protein